MKRAGAKKDLLSRFELTLACLPVIPLFLCLLGLQGVELGLLLILIQTIPHLKHIMYDPLPLCSIVGSLFLLFPLEQIQGPLHWPAVAQMLRVLWGLGASPCRQKAERVTTYPNLFLYREQIHKHPFECLIKPINQPVCLWMTETLAGDTVCLIVT